MRFIKYASNLLLMLTFYAQNFIRHLFSNLYDHSFKKNQFKVYQLKSNDFLLKKRILVTNFKTTKTKS